MLHLKTKIIEKYFNKRIIFILLIILLVSLFIYSLPSFLFNEFEFQFRKEFSSALESIDKAENGIEKRRSGLLGSDDPGDEIVNHGQEMMNYGEAIESSIKESIAYIKNAQTYNKKQENLLPFLSSNYLNYHQKKIESINDCQRITDEYLIRKQNEQMVTDTSLLIFLVGEKIRNMQDADQWWEAIGTLPSTTQIIRSNTQKLYEDNFIGQEMFDYYMNRVEVTEFTYNEIQKVADSGNWNTFDAKGLSKLGANEVDSYQIFIDHNLKTQVSLNEAYRQVSKNDDKLREASDFYNDNKLAYDKISILLGLFSGFFPRMGFTETTQPTIIPTNINEGTISLLN